MTLEERTKEKLVRKWSFLPVHEQMDFKNLSC